MKLCIPTTFEESYVQAISQLNNKHYGFPAKEFYGSYAKSVVGSIRPSKILPQVDENGMKKHIFDLHEKGFKFDYTLNSSCQSNLEYTPGGIKNIIELLDNLSDSGVDRITVSNPVLINIIKSKYPKFSLSLSVTKDINNIMRARAAQDQGVDRLVLSRDINRNFSLLEKIRSAVSVELEILVNSPCLFFCLNRDYHRNVASHGSTEQVDGSSGQYSSYITVWCTYNKLRDPSSFIKTPWIRPEDVKYYSDIGIEFFKIDGRGKPSDRLLYIIEPYMAQHFEGNFYSLIDRAFWDKTTNDDKLDPLVVYIENNKLGNFLDFFRTNHISCTDRDCKQCHYCEDVEKRVVNIDCKLLEKYLAKYHAALFTSDIPLFEESRKCNEKL